MFTIVFTENNSENKIKLNFLARIRSGIHSTHSTQFSITFPSRECRKTQMSTLVIYKKKLSSSVKKAQNLLFHRGLKHLAYILTNNITVTSGRKVLLQVVTTYCWLFSIYMHPVTWQWCTSTPSRVHLGKQAAVFTPICSSPVWEKALTNWTVNCD